MARTETNDAKRNEMKELIAALTAKGMTRKGMAELALVSESAISSYAAGKSMGTNLTRDIFRTVAAGETLAEGLMALVPALEAKMAAAHPMERDWFVRRIAGLKTLAERYQPAPVAAPEVAQVAQEVKQEAPAPKAKRAPRKLAAMAPKAPVALPMVSLDAGPILAALAAYESGLAARTAGHAAAMDALTMWARR